MKTAECTCGSEGAALGPRLFSVGRNGTRFHVRPCLACERGLLDPVPPANGLLAAYDEAYYGRGARKFVEPIQAGIGWFRRGRARHALRFLKPASAGSRRALDIGCGDGEFLGVLQQLGWECHGTELTEVTARRASEVGGLRLRTGTLASDAYEPGHFDVVSLWHVLEHLPDPDRTLRDCARWLRDDGLLLLAVPNLDSWQARLFRGAWFHLDPPFHLHHFAPRSLARALAGAGFEVVETRHLSWQYNPYGVVQSFLNALGFPRDELYEVLKGNQPLRPASRVAQALLAALALPPAIAMTLAEAAAGRGGTIEVTARRRATAGERRSAS
jgi:2-polyprenyl-3-methyl-5-hydroxy-6-metoxy-1,4-benzoquinol methylase